MRSLNKARRRGVLLRLALVLAAGLLALAPLRDGSQRQETAGQGGAATSAGAFDNYLLALSWMPGLCAAGTLRADDPRCGGADAVPGWQVHGLWPQHRGGSWPEYCRSPYPDPSRSQTAREAALFGTSGAAWHQWNKHGSCTGLSAEAYFALTRQAVAVLSLPDPLGFAGGHGQFAPAALTAAMVAQNPGHSTQSMITTCRAGLLQELRLCLTRDLEPRPCDQELLVRACSRNALRLQRRRRAGAKSQRGRRSSPVDQSPAGFFGQKSCQEAPPPAARAARGAAAR